MLLTLVACGEDIEGNQVIGSSADRTENKDANTVEDGFVLKNEDSVDIGKPVTTLLTRNILIELNGRLIAC